MGKYLSIGELSKISGSSIRCLRYYDEIGILKPAFINKDTGYRYYTFNQLPTLAVIQACTDLDIPLKNFDDYKTDEGIFDLHKLVQTGETLAREKIHELEQTVKKLTALSEYLAVTRDMDKSEKWVLRRIEKHSLVTVPFYGDILNEYERMKAETDLYKKLKSNGTAVLYRQGFLFRCKNGEKGIPFCFSEIIDDGEYGYEILRIPSGEYQCRFFPLDEMERAYREAFGGSAPSEETAVLFSDYLDNKQERYIEVQKVPMQV